MEKKLTVCFVLVVTLILSGSVSAAVYKCKAEDGSIEYSQMPCPSDAQSKVLATRKSSSSSDCRYVNEFAKDLASRMRQGRKSDQAIQSHGGLGSIPKGRLAIINNVYYYEVNRSVSVEKIASIVTAKCRNGSFGAISKVDIPESYYIDEEMMVRPDEMPRFEPEKSCQYARRYAKDVAKKMKGGYDSKQEIDSRGGINNISKKLLSIINDIYYYRVSASVSADKIASTIQTKCRNGVYGQLEEMDIPEQYYDRSRNLSSPRHGIDIPTQGNTQSEGRGIKKFDNPDVDAMSKKACENARQRIKQIDAAMRSGYSSEESNSLRAERRVARDLERQLCK